MDRRLAFLVACLVMPAWAAADIYRCQIDGRTTFRDRPCPAGQAGELPSASASGWAGCYRVETHGYETGKVTDLMRVSGNAGHYQLDVPNAPSGGPQGIALRRATVTELGLMGKNLKAEALDGLVADSQDHAQVFMGLFKVRDEYRDAKYFFFGYFSSGWATPTTCTAAPKAPSR